MIFGNATQAQRWAQRIVTPGTRSRGHPMIITDYLRNLNWPGIAAGRIRRRIRADAGAGGGPDYPSLVGWAAGRQAMRTKLTRTEAGPGRGNPLRRRKTKQVQCLRGRSVAPARRLPYGMPPAVTVIMSRDQAGPSLARRARTVTQQSIIVMIA